MTLQPGPIDGNGPSSQIGGDGDPTSRGAGLDQLLESELRSAIRRNLEYRRSRLAAEFWELPTEKRGSKGEELHELDAALDRLDRSPDPSRRPLIRSFLGGRLGK